MAWFLASWHEQLPTFFQAFCISFAPFNMAFCIVKHWGLFPLPSWRPRPEILPPSSLPLAVASINADNNPTIAILKMTVNILKCQLLRIASYLNEDPKKMSNGKQSLARSLQMIYYKLWHEFGSVSSSSPGTTGPCGCFLRVSLLSPTVQADLTVSGYKLFVCLVYQVLRQRSWANSTAVLSGIRQRKRLIW